MNGGPGDGRCCALTQAETRCRRDAEEATGLCWQHAALVERGRPLHVVLAEVPFDEEEYDPDVPDEHQQDALMTAEVREGCWPGLWEVLKRAAATYGTGQLLYHAYMAIDWVAQNAPPLQMVVSSHLHSVLEPPAPRQEPLRRDAPQYEHDAWKLIGYTMFPLLRSVPAER